MLAYFALYSTDAQCAGLASKCMVVTYKSIANNIWRKDVGLTYSRRLLWLFPCTALTKEDIISEVTAHLICTEDPMNPFFVRQCSFVCHQKNWQNGWNRRGTRKNKLCWWQKEEKAQNPIRQTYDRHFGRIFDEWQGMPESYTTDWLGPAFVFETVSLPVIIRGVK